MEKPDDGPRPLALRHSQSASVSVGKTHVAVLIIRKFLLLWKQVLPFNWISPLDVMKFSDSTSHQSYSPLWPLKKKTPRENLKMSKKSKGN